MLSGIIKGTHLPKHLRKTHVLFLFKKLTLTMTNPAIGFMPFTYLGCQGHRVRFTRIRYFMHTTTLWHIYYYLHSNGGSVPSSYLSRRFFPKTFVGLSSSEHPLSTGVSWVVFLFSLHAPPSDFICFMPSPTTHVPIILVSICSAQV